MDPILVSGGLARRVLTLYHLPRLPGVRGQGSGVGQYLGLQYHAVLLPEAMQQPVDAAAVAQA